MKLLKNSILFSLTCITLNGFAQCISSVTPTSPDICKGDSITLSVTGLSNKALKFDGVNDFVNLSTLTRPSNTFTIEAWFKTSLTHETDVQSTTGVGGTSGQHYLFGATYANPNDAGMGVSVGTNGISVYEHSTNYMPATAVYSSVIDTGWNHLAVVYTNKTPSVYLNGVLVKTGLASPRTNVLSSFQIGGDGSYGYFTGMIDEVRIWNTARTQTEISTNMSLSLTGNENGLVSYWRIDEGNGTVTNDATSNHTKATLNGPVWVNSSTSSVVYPALSYSWTPAAGLSDTSGAVVVAKPSSTTTYTVIGKGSNCGSDTASVTVTINNPNIVITGTTALCNNGSSMLSVASLIDDTAYKYKWNTNDTTKTITAKPDSTTTYWVAVTNSKLCTDTAFATIQLAKVTATVSVKDSVLCQGNSTTLTAGGGTKYVWNTGNPADTNAVLTIKPLKDTKYSVTVFNCLCSDSIQKTVKVNSLPSIQTNNDTTVISGDSVSLSANGTNIISYLWIPSTGLNNTAVSNPIANPTVTTTYTVTGTDANGCSNSDSVKLSVKEKEKDKDKDAEKDEDCKFFIPNAFSPNSNGFNDTLYARGCTGEVKDVTFAIYNRWGKKIFETKDISKGWNGTFNGKPVNSEVFVYYIKAVLLNGKEIEQKGNVSIIR